MEVVYYSDGNYTMKYILEGKPLWFFIAVLNIAEILKTKTKDCHHHLSLLTLEYRLFADNTIFYATVACNIDNVTTFFDWRFI